MSDKKEAPDGLKSRISNKKKVILALIGMSALAVGGYHLQILLEAQYYGTTYTRIKELRKGSPIIEYSVKKESKWLKDQGGRKF